MFDDLTIFIKTYHKRATLQAQKNFWFAQMAMRSCIGFRLQGIQHSLHRFIRAFVEIEVFAFARSRFCFFGKRFKKQSVNMRKCHMVLMMPYGKQNENPPRISEG